jgi:hypothetical protein
MRFLFLLLFLPCVAFSEAETAEITATPLFGYSSHYGFETGADLGVDFTLTDRWQVGAGGSYFSNFSTDSKSKIYFGPTYNFSDDLQRSYFLGGGVGYENHFPGMGDPPSAVGFVKFGKRFLLSEKYHITYKPAITATVGRGAAELNLSILSFSILF